MSLILGVIFNLKLLSAGEICFDLSKPFLLRPSEDVRAEIQLKGEREELLNELLFSLGNEGRRNEMFDVYERILPLTIDKESVRIKIAELKSWFGVDSLKKGETEKAKKFFEESIDIYYSLPTQSIQQEGVAVRIGKSLSNLGRHDEALGFFKMGAKLDTTPTHYGRYEYAYASLNYIIELSKKSYPNVNDLLREIIEQKDYIKAHLPSSTSGVKKFRELEKRIEDTYAKLEAAKNVQLTLARPNISEFKDQEWLALGTWYHTLNLNKEAIAVYNILLNKDPYSAEAQRLKAAVYLSDTYDPQGVKKAEALLKESIFNDPKNELSAIDLFKIYLRENDSYLASKVAIEAITQQGNKPSLLLNFAQGYFLFGLRTAKNNREQSKIWMKEASDLIEQYFDIYGFDLESLRIATDSSSHLQDYEKTLLYGRMYLEQGGAEPHTLQSISSALRNTGEYAESIPLIEKIIPEFDPKIMAKYYYSSCAHLGHSYLMVNDYEKAIKYLTIASEFSKVHKSTFWNLAMAYKALKKEKQAIEAMETVFQMDKKDKRAADFLAKAYAEMGDTENASYFENILIKLKY